MTNPRPLRRLAAATAVAIALTACGGGDPAVDVTSEPAPVSSSSTDEPTAEAGPAVVAGLGILADAVDRATGEEPEEFAAAGDGDELAEGDVVRTDATGFAQLDYVDGSLTRVDVDTTVTITSLGGAETPEVDLELDVGRVWNNVQDLDDDASFEVSTDVGVAAVRGTVFIVECYDDGSCLFAVVEGVVEVTLNGGDVLTLNAGDQVLVLPDGTSDEGVLPSPDGFLDDPWFQSNLDLDGGGDGDASAVGAVGPLAGDYEVTLTLDNLTVDTTLTADTYDGVEPFQAVIAPNQFRGLPTTVGASTTSFWTIKPDGSFVTDSNPPVGTFAPEGDRFTAGYRDLDTGFEACVGTSVQTLFLILDPGDVTDDAVQSFTGTLEQGTQDPDSDTCSNVRFDSLISFTATRIGPPSLDREFEPG